MQDSDAAFVEARSRRGIVSRRSGGTREAAEALAAIVNYSSDAIFGRTMDGTVTSWNRAAEGLFGYPAEQMIGKSSKILLPPNRHDEWVEILGRVRRGDAIRCFETERLRRDGSIIHVALTLSPIRNARHQLTGISTIARDITEERRAKEALRRNGQELAQLFDYAPFALFWLKRDGTIERLNNTGREWLETKGEEAERRWLGDFVTQPALFQKLLKRLADGQVVKNLQMRMRRGGGTARTVMVYANGLWESQKLVHTHWFLRDVTAQRQLEQEILAISERERQRFAHELHDGLGQHLSGVAYLADSLAEELEECEAPQTAAARRLKQLVEQSIQLTRGIARGLLPVRTEPEGLMIALRELAAQTKAVFRVQCQFTNRGPVLIEDETTARHLYRIAQEAVHNAIRHGNAKRIQVILNRNRRRVYLAVRDNGCGIDEESRRDEGMGLHIMRYRAGLCNGTITIQRRKRRGTEVLCSIDLPMNKPDGPAASFKPTLDSTAV